MYHSYCLWQPTVSVEGRTARVAAEVVSAPRGRPLVRVDAYELGHRSQSYVTVASTTMGCMLQSPRLLLDCVRFD